MNINTPLDRLTLVSISFMIIPIFILAYSSPQWTSEIYIYGQETNSSNNDEFLLNINQTYLSLIPLMIEEVQNTNASDIPIKQIMEATPSNATALQDIVKNNSNKASQNKDNATLNNSNSSRPQDLIPVVVNMTQNTNASDIPIKNIINTVPSNATALQDIVKNNSNKAAQNKDNATLNNSNSSRPQDLIPVVVNMTQNTNASDIPIKNIINTVPSNATALQDIVKNNSNKAAQNKDSAILNNATVNNSNPSRPQDLIPVVVNMTQNTNASDLGFMRIINALPGYDNSESNSENFLK